MHPQLRLTPLTLPAREVVFCMFVFMIPTIDLTRFYSNFHNNAQLTKLSSHVNIVRVEDAARRRNKKPVAYSRRSFYKISIVKGRGTIHYAERSFEIKGTTIVLTNPLVPFHWQISDPNQTGYIFLFTEDFLGRMIDLRKFPAFKRPENSVLPLNAKQRELFITLFESAYEELQSGYEYKYDLVRIKLLEIIHQACKIQPASGAAVSSANAAERIASVFTELLNRQFPIETNNQQIRFRTPVAFAKQLNVHINHLNKALKEVTGMSTFELIHDRVIDEAKILLKTTDWSITDIGECLGFNESQHFTSFFKSRLHITPRQFRSGK
jgi:AraC family transcriptional activator of pobA